MSEDPTLTRYPFHPSDYTLRLDDMLADADYLKYIGGWWSFLSGLLALFFNGLVLRLVLKRLKSHYNIDMMLVSVVLSIDLLYCGVVIVNQILMVATSYNIYYSNVWVQISGFLIPFLILISLYMVAILSFERYMFTVKGIKWTPWSYYSLAVGYVSPPLILGLVGAATSQFMPMPSCVYSLVLIDQSSFGAIYIGFFTIQSIMAGLVFNSSYLSILMHHRKLLLNPTSEYNENEIKTKVKTTNGNNDVLSLPAMLQQPVPSSFKLREAKKSKQLANTLLYKTFLTMIVYNLICFPEILALAYELVSLNPRNVVWDFVVVITISNHALISPLVVLFLHQPTNDDWQIYRAELVNSFLSFLGSKRRVDNRNRPSYEDNDQSMFGKSKSKQNTVDLDTLSDFVTNHSQDPILDSASSHIEPYSKYSKEEAIVYQA
ncbi:hypothetical protein K502DRAFT_87611 [Neoconidiobolus thromboides FSU 785]|nr:hypothetical protein K502DRAFT_87611 [Neoconidiobolus thromboides FSU 785]